MTHVSFLRRRVFAGSVLSIVCLRSAGLSAGQFRSLFGDKSTSYRPFKDPAGRFELEYPNNKDWRQINGGSSLAVFTHKDGPALFVDHLRLAERLTPAEIEALAENGIDKLKEQYPTAKEFKPGTLETKAGRGVLIRYLRVGTEAETVVQCSIPVGQDLFRLNGVIPDKEVTKFEPIIMHMIESFKAPADPAGAKK